MAQFLRPDSNVTQTSFTGGFAEIDESTASDADFAYGADNTSAVLEVGLSNPSATPAAGTTTVRYRIAKTDGGLVVGSGNSVDVTCHVYQGTTLIASDTARTADGTWTTYSFNPDMSGVTDWTDLRLRFTTTASGGSLLNRRGAAVSWAELEVPDGSSAQGLTPSLFTNTQTFYAPTVSASYALTPSLFSNSQSFYAPTVASVNGLAPSLFSNSQTFYAPTVSQDGGAQNLTPSLFTNANSLFAPTVAPGAVTLAPSLFNNSTGPELISNGTFDSATTGWTANANATISVVSGRLRVEHPASGMPAYAYQTIATEVGKTYTVTAELFSATNIPSLQVGTGLGTSDLGSVSGSGTRSVTFVATGTTTYVHLELDSNSNPTYAEFDNATASTARLFGPTVSAGAVTLQPSLLTNANTLYAPTVSSGLTTLEPPLLTNSQTLYSPTVAAGAVTLTPSLYVNSAPELVSNGTFDSSTAGWTASNATLSVVGGRLRVTSTSTFAYGYQVIATEIGKQYRVTAQGFSGTSTASISVGTSVGSSSYGSGGTSLDLTFTATTTTTYISCGVTGTGLYNDYDNVSASPVWFPAPTVSPGALALSPSLLTNAQTFYGSTIGTGPATLSPPLLTNEQAFYSPTVSGAGDLAPTLLVNTSVLYAPAIGSVYALAPSLLTNAQVLYSPTLEIINDIQPPLLTNSQTIFAPTVTAATPELRPELLVNVQEIFLPTVRRMWEPSINPGAAVLTMAADPASAGITMEPDPGDVTVSDFDY